VETQFPVSLVYCWYWELCVVASDCRFFSRPCIY